MPNTFITPDIVAREAVLALENNLVAAGLIYRDFDGDFDGAVGDTITVRKPATFTVDEWNGSTLSVQAATEGSTTVTLNKVPDVSVNLTAKDRALELKDFSKQIVTPAMMAIAQWVDSNILALAKDIPYSCAVGGTPAMADIAAVRKIAVINKMPVGDRHMVLDPTTVAKYLILDAILGAEKSGSTDALREANIGRILGFNTYESQNVVASANGTAVATGSTTEATGDLGATEIALASVSAATATFKKGQLFTIAGDDTTYVITADKTASSSAVAALPIYPALQKAAASAKITLIAAHNANIAFHRNCFAMVTRTLPAPMGGNASAVANYNGIGVRVVYGYDMATKSDTISFDFLAGFKTLTPELGVRFRG